MYVYIFYCHAEPVVTSWGVLDINHSDTKTIIWFL